MKFVTDVHAVQRNDPIDFGDPNFSSIVTSRSIFFSVIRSWIKTRFCTDIHGSKVIMTLVIP